MGFLNNTTNNVIIDACLTDYGRRALSRNDGSFSIVKFALGDEEVDYTLLTQYGNAVGREKIIKNTPVLEASTSAAYGIKSKLLSSAVQTDNIGFLKAVTGISYALDLINTKTATVEMSQETSSGLTIPTDLTNQVYIVKLDNKFLSIRGRTPRMVTSDQQAHYYINRDAVINSFNGSKATIQIDVKSNITSATFSTYGTTSTSNKIRTYVTFTGKESGQSSTIEVEISK